MILLVLYEELAAYFVKCISTFALQHKVDVHVIRKEVNKEAPFELNLVNIKTYNREDYNDKQLMDLARIIKPDALFCGGWSSKVYLKIASQYKGEIPSVIAFDNKWEGSLKQHIASIVAPFYITNKFNKCFVPGIEQKKFAQKIGFKEDQIITGVYCCDFDLFYNQYLANKAEKQKQFPKRFIYTGRYVEHKGIKDLWQAFIELQKENPNDWELWCLGAGDLEPIVHSKIKHFGFVQPNELTRYIKDSGVFVLPSHFEPWGVVVHEYAAAGFPIICSDEVGARVSFVEQNVNGYIYKAGDVKELKGQLKKIMNLTKEELVEMGERSVEKAKKITPEIWAETLMRLLN